jgi:phosphohistidine phosphatase
MQIILWRHADAEDGANDLERKLTPKGRKQAADMAAWLLERLNQFHVVASPAMRAQQTAEALGTKITTVKALSPGASVNAILKAADWPDGDGTVVLVGHQPDLGNAVAYLVSGQESDWRLKKGALWWIESGNPPLVRAAVSPDLL